MTFLTSRAVDKNIKNKTALFRKSGWWYFHIFEVLPIFLSLQMKRSVFIINKYCTYELQYDLRLKILENYKISEKSQNFLDL